MLRTFNCGIGMCAVLSPRDVPAAQALLEKTGVASWPIGVIEAAPGLAEPDVVFTSAGA
jgi:phosphoribosylformylglycinamidine cyclo-ligase